jgi:hypothetical protein
MPRGPARLQTSPPPPPPPLQVQNQLISRSDEAWSRSGVLAHLPSHLRSLALTSDTSLPAAPAIRLLLARFTALRSLRLGAGYGVTSEQVGRGGVGRGGVGWAGP